LELEEDFNAGDFGKKGRDIIKKIINSGKIPIIVGGSGLYIDSLVTGLFDFEALTDDEDLKKSQKQIREKLYDELKSSGLEKLVNKLKKVDPETVKNIPQVTERRVIRALEVFYLTGVPISAHKSKKINIEFTPVKIGIKHNREELYKRINERVDNMLAIGLIDEVKALKEKAYHYKDYNSLNTVGIKEVFDWLDDKISYDRMIELIKQNTRRFAKRQMTWFRRYKDIKWTDINSEIAKW
ncbi:MAG TPA: tRNA (adenosine(37)-N6)-dimethylallyltransferase MiaA, partial [Ignavibacteria bacterium]|nr:tRNA (adenosine(37)-N6)-dimethylallyltransferase MiaA [Ignavibacteria bacterium]